MYDSDLYICNVPWASDYKNLLDFPNSKAQQDCIKGLSLKHFENISFVPKDNQIIIAENIGHYYTSNYIMFRNSSVSSKWWYAFIQRIDFNTPNTTVITYTTDVWQSYQFSFKFYRSMIERGHIKKSYDKIGNNIAPEPIGFGADYEKEIEIFKDIDFTPVLMFSAISDPGLTEPGQYNFGGFGQNENMTGIYMYHFNDFEIGKKVINLWALNEELSTYSHLNETIGFSFLPKWVYNSSSKLQIAKPLGVSVITSNSSASISDTVSVNTTTLACGYKPRNNKMFTSLCRSYLLFNQNGFSYPLRPELINGDNLKIKVSMKPVNSNNFRLDIVNYAKYPSSYIQIPYNFTVAMGINSNVGTAQQVSATMAQNQVELRDFSNAMSYVGQAGNMIGSVVSGAMSANIGQIIGGVVGGATNIAQEYQQYKVDDFSNRVGVGNAYESKALSIGMSTDTNAMSSNRCRLRLADCSPTYRECQIVDDFLDYYGYAISQVGDPNIYLHSRSNWNYLKLTNCEMKFDGVAEDEQRLKQIFLSGTTIWHDIKTFGDYTQSNV